MAEPTIYDDDKFAKQSLHTTSSMDLVYGCKSCNIRSNDRSGRMCPCPRGSCEATVVGRSTTVVKFYPVKKGGKDG